MHCAPRGSGLLRAFPAPALLAAAALLLAACSGGGGGDDGRLDLFTTNQAVAANTPVVLSGEWLAYLADEGTTGSGGDLNGDLDSNDGVAVAVRMTTGLETTLGVAARDLAWVGANLYLVVDEAADGRDWDGTPGSDVRVLLFWTLGMSAPVFVDELSTDGPLELVATEDFLFYAAAATVNGATRTNLFALAVATPMTRRPVASTDMAGALHPRILGVDEGLVFLTLDETVEGRDLNGDGPATDGRVLALLDGTGATDAMGYTLPVRNVGLAIPAADAPFRARATAAHDWLLGFLVDEQAQGATNFNDPGTPAAMLPPSWTPAQCIGFEDADTDDSVLFFLRFADWVAATAAPVNTGLVGSLRVLVAGDWLGTISPEGDQGTCELNEDGDTTDLVFRWVQAVTPVVPPSAGADMHAIEDLPGGAFGVAELEGRFVIVVDELEDALDLNADGFFEQDLVGWLDPDAGGPWTFDHEPGAPTAYAEATWLAEQVGRQRLGLAFAESTDLVDRTNDGDADDALATFPRFRSSPDELLFPGFAVACDSDSAGIVVRDGWGFYRVSEAEHGRDLDGNGSATDMLLWRSDLTTGETRQMALLNALPGRPAIEAEARPNVVGAAFLAQESLAGDLNGDMDATDIVVRYFVW